MQERSAQVSPSIPHAHPWHQAEPCKASTVAGPRMRSGGAWPAGASGISTATAVSIRAAGLAAVASAAAPAPPLRLAGGGGASSGGSRSSRRPPFGMTGGVSAKEIEKKKNFSFFSSPAHARAFLFTAHSN